VTALLVIPLAEAVTVTVPPAIPVRSPAFTVAMVLADVDHVADEVTF